MKQAPRRHGKQKPAASPGLLSASTQCRRHRLRGRGALRGRPADRDPTPVRAFTTFTADLHRLADWLLACGVTPVAMESTGVYSIPLYEILEARGLDVVLVNARHVKHVAARKSDVRLPVAAGIAQRQLAAGSFRPTAAIAALRAYLRHRETLVQSASTHIQRMQKALVQMNLQLSVVLSDITGVTGQRIVRDIVRARPTPTPSRSIATSRCQASEADIIAALTGHYRPEHLFVLPEPRAVRHVSPAAGACDVAIEAHVATLAAQAPPPAAPLPAPHEVQAEGARQCAALLPRTPLHLSPVYLTQLYALSPYSALRLLAEIGTHMSRCPTEKHFTSSLTLPLNKISAPPPQPKPCRPQPRRRILPSP